MSSFFFLGIVVIFSILGIRELFEPGFFESHDGIIHVMRLAQFDQALKDGQFPVRWLPTWMAGYGSPVFNFNWSLPYYLGSILHTLGLSYQTSVETVFALTYSLSGIFCYLLIKKLLANNWAALTGSILYIWAPYRFTDIFIRGALGEASAFLFLPLLFWLTLQLIESASNLKLLFTSLAWAGFILTHNIMSLVGVGIVSSFLVWKLINESGQRQSFKKVFLAIVLGIGLSTFFILPAVLEKKYSKISELANLYNFHDQFVSPKALIYSKWQYAYAVPINQQFSMSFQLGLVHWLIPLLAGIVLLANRKINLRADGIFFLGIFGLAIFMTTTASRPLYETTFLPSVINFPWRFLTIATFAASLLAGILVVLVKRLRVFLTLGILIAVVFLYWPFSKIVSWKFSATDSDYRNMIKTNINFLPDTEFLPKDTRYLQLFEEQGPAYSRPFFEDETSRSTIADIQNKHLSHTAGITTTLQPTVIRANTFYFPGWKLYVDNQEAAITKDQYGLIKFSINPGSHDIRLVFKNTPTRTVANTISIATLILLVFLLIKETKRLKFLKFKSAQQ